MFKKEYNHISTFHQSLYGLFWGEMCLYLAFCFGPYEKEISDFHLSLNKGGTTAVMTNSKTHPLQKSWEVK